MNDHAIEQEIIAKGKTAPRVTPSDIMANIASEYYFTASDGVLGSIYAASEDGDIGDAGAPVSLSLLTFCVITLANGFTVSGESACASPENFDAEIGRKVARDNAVQKIWPLMGYALKQQLHEQVSVSQQPAPGAAHVGYSTRQPHQQRVVDERAELDDKISKLAGFFGTDLFTSLPGAERVRLRDQAIVMRSYSAILAERIAAFTPAEA